MNLTFQEAEDLIAQLITLLEDFENDKVEVVICTPFPYVELATDLAQGTNLRAGAQNVSQFDEGAYTGEVSAGMLESMETDFCIVGHSERRKYFNEEGEQLAGKINRLLEKNIIPIFCCGEVLPQREKNEHFTVVENQIREALFHLTPDQFEKIVIAYEPVWAIGTGRNATPAQAQEMHAFIRRVIREKFGEDIAENLSILYGGSCNPKNAKSLFANPDVDGGLIGGASLKADDFFKVIKSI